MESRASQSGRGTIANGGSFASTVTSTTVVTVEITRAFQSTTLAANNWTVDSSPQTSCTPQDLGSDGKADPVGSIITLTLGVAGCGAAQVAGDPLPLPQELATALDLARQRGGPYPG